MERSVNSYVIVAQQLYFLIDATPMDSSHHLLEAVAHLSYALRQIINDEVAVGLGTFSLEPRPWLVDENSSATLAGRG